MKHKDRSRIAATKDLCPKLLRLIDNYYFFY
jgi:hypothetical protein